MKFLSKLRATFSHNLIFFREKRRWTQYDLAEVTGISVAAIRSYEQESRTAFPRPGQLEAIAKALQVKPYQLLQSSDDLDVTSREILELLRDALDDPNGLRALAQALDSVPRKRKK